MNRKKKKEGFVYLLWEDKKKRREIFAIPQKIYDELISGKAGESIRLQEQLSGEEIVFSRGTLLVMFEQGEIF